MTIIQKLLADKTVLVIGSAVMAFTEVCPERVDLIHRVYRKLCALIVDVDEWGQVVIVNMLTVYARMQFANPNLNVCNSELFLFFNTNFGIVKLENFDIFDLDNVFHFNNVSAKHRSCSRRIFL